MVLGALNTYTPMEECIPEVKVIIEQHEVLMKENSKPTMKVPEQAQQAQRNAAIASMEIDLNGDPKMGDAGQPDDPQERVARSKALFGLRYGRVDMHRQLL